jgi:chitin synthase
MLIPNVVARWSIKFITDFEQKEFCEQYVPTMRVSVLERIRQCAASNGWTEVMDYLTGHRSI